ncbi:unnamed protein product [Rhizoctonia solani]|uniref:Transmembrane protein n=1 Tax=Rhizoctonia solani TaxID=456999 RepID=A0A8H3BZ21_9AGAM|nr:unnamed protein product [Rhizoctonia solani]
MASFHSASLILWLLVLSIMTSALPTSSDTQQLASRRNGNDVFQRVSDLQTEVELITRTIAELAVVTEATAFVELLAIKIDTCAKLVGETARETDIDSSVKVDVAVKVTTIITLLFNLCIALVTKFGVRLVLPLLVKMDTCILTLLSILNVCANSMQSLLPAALDSSMFSQAYLKLSASALDSINI